MSMQPWLVGLALFGTALNASAAKPCGSDMDCPGEQICEAGTCVTPKPAAPAPAATPAGGKCKTAAACEKQCTEGVAQGCADASDLYDHGKDANPQRAASFAKRACELSNLELCVRYGQMLSEGAGVAKDVSGAQFLFKQACDQRSAAGCRELGLRYEASKVAKEQALAAGVYGKACDAGDALGCARLGRLYLWGLSVERDPTRAAQAFKTACDKGHPGACLALAAMMERGLGVGADAVAAQKLRSKAPAVRAPSDTLELPVLSGSAGADVAITSDPPGADLTVDGMSAGKTPVSIRMPVGKHVVEARFKGGDRQVQETTVVAGQAATVVFGVPGRLTVVTTPSAAHLTVDGADAGTSPYSGRLAAGEHAVVAALDGYQQAQQKVQVQAGGEQVEKLTLSPLPTAIDVTTTPPGATLQIDGAKAGTTPWTATVTPGSHKLTVTLRGYKSAKDTVKVKRGETVTRDFTLEPERVKWTLESVPSGAAVTVDGKAAGKTPLRDTIAIGEHLLVLKADGYEPLELKVQVPPDSPPVKQQYTLEKARLALNVVTVPAGATVFVDGAKVGTSPYQARLTPGSHAVAAEAEGYNRAEATISGESGQTVEQKLTLVPVAFELTIETDPPGALVYVDGQEKGLGPLKVMLPTGSHRLRATLDGYVSAVAEQQMKQEAATVKLKLTQLAVQPSGTSAAPAADPKVALEHAAADLANPAMSAEDKRKLVEERAAGLGAAQLLELINAVSPAGLRGELCMKWSAMLPKALLVVNALDPFNDDVTATVQVNGVAVGAALGKHSTEPGFQVPVCANHVVVSAPGLPDQESDVRLSVDAPNKVKVQFPGRPPLIVLNVLGEYGRVMSPNEDDVLMTGGLGFEYYGKHFHIGLDLKAGWLNRSSNGPPSFVDQLFPHGFVGWAIPVPDVFFGFTHIGHVNDLLSIHFTVDVGAWSIFYPGGRVSLGVGFNDRFLISAFGWVNYFWPDNGITWAVGGSFGVAFH